MEDLDFMKETKIFSTDVFLYFADFFKTHVWYARRPTI